MMVSFPGIRRFRPVFALALVLTPAFSALAADTAHDAANHAHEIPNPIWTAPFLMILGAIALFPLHHKTAHAWEKNSFKLSLSIALALVVLAYYGSRSFGFHGSGTGSEAVSAVLEHALVQDYAPFVILLFSLYVAAGGLRFEADLIASPTNNTIMLGIGAVLASLIGTTGASMLMIRPLLQTNSERTKVTHTVVFFIFLVSNIGGLLTPIGDPPLFLGYLQGVPFLWTLRLFPFWLACVATLLAIYWVWDWSIYRTEPYRALIADKTILLPPKVRGQVNFPILVLMVLSVAFLVPDRQLLGWTIPHHAREVVLLTLAAISLGATPRGIRSANDFNYHAIIEVAALFLGIFVTMQVPMEILKAKGPSLGLSQPTDFFWATGFLSSFLDNAPTYLVFLETAKTLPTSQGMTELALGAGHVAEHLLAAISLGAVFMGANTYIGNGPNFMVKSIAEQSGVKMPSFFGYMAYSVGILIPLFILISLVGL
ncbi:sodium:proton antiporter [bacterium]|nr:sodium:proton antiporter [bacterium]